MHQSEEDFLVLAAQSGDRRAIGALYGRDYQRLLRYAYKVSGTADMAQEAVQDAWIKAMRTLIRLEDPRAFRSWLYQLVRWRAMDLMRAANRYHHEPEQLFEEAAAPLEGSDDDAELLRLAINRLPSVEKQVVQLFYLDELEVREIAKVLGIASGTVKSRLSRARSLLKQRLDIN